MYFSLVTMWICLGVVVDGQGFYRGYRRYRGNSGRGYAGLVGYGGSGKYRPENVNVRRHFAGQTSALKLLHVEPHTQDVTPGNSQVSPSLPQTTDTAPQLIKASTRPVLSSTRPALSSTRPGLSSTKQVLPVDQKDKESLHSASKMRNPYLSIDPVKFEVVPAVPGVDIIKHSNRVPKTITPGQDASVLIPDRFMPVPAVPITTSEVDRSDSVQVDDVTNTVEEVRVAAFTQVAQVIKQSNRVPKTITPGQEASVLIPDRFMPVQAVPITTSEVDRSDSVQVDDVTNTVEEVRVAAFTQVAQATPVTEDNTFLAPSAGRKQFKRCHGKCVQKFCLPIDSLSVFDKCTDKCKGICTQ
eukprot:GFUD01091202.1.p1 GENE.GFUD01091202.1~~GFUD01091202.1.p1  ORF type:complete len:356 (+),score=93.31 GFUD01091202.1:54-1121(+)